MPLELVAVRRVVDMHASLACDDVGEVARKPVRRFEIEDDLSGEHVASFGLHPADLFVEDLEAAIDRFSEAHLLLFRDARDERLTLAKLRILFAHQPDDLARDLVEERLRDAEAMAVPNRP